jgi:hypothetical protein
MTPKEKAQELYNKFVYWLPDSGDISKQDVQQCALIAVDEILSNFIVECADTRYWKEVKQEIESL